MDAKFINPFLSALTTVMPQVGFKNVARGKIFTKEQFVDSLGVTVQVAITSQPGGNVIFNMSEQTAKKLCSTMMMGMPVESLDDVAQSAVSELANMIVSNATTALNQGGFAVKIASPVIALGGGAVKVNNAVYIAIEMVIDEFPMLLAIGLNT